MNPAQVTRIDRVPDAPRAHNGVASLARGLLSIFFACTATLRLQKQQPKYYSNNITSMGDETASHLTDEQSSLLEHSRSSATRAIHADDFLNTGKDVAPPMHVSTTFRYEEDPEKLEPFSQWNVSRRTSSPVVVTDSPQYE